LSDILPLVRSGKKVLVAAHGNSLRALLKHLERMSEDEIEAVNIPTGLPRIYTLDAEGLAKATSYVGDPAEVEARIQSVANQTKKG
jgi:2,3-bisphosphoglycerate-dependent phosphoglycerate mutase